MLPPQLPKPAHLSLFSTAISCSRGSVICSGRRRGRRPKPKPIALPPAPLRRLVSSSLRRLLPRPRLLGGGWLGRQGRRGWKAPAEEIALLVLSLAFGDRLTVLAESWRASGLGQALGIWAALWGRGRRRRSNGLRRLAALFLGIAFCALVSHFRGAALLEGLGKTSGAGRKLARILLH
ncbi:hypothetical protein BRADI_1g23095v3 [Brachypodium distachyon]|uniref:Uncharacterized protein n=2 Tax=Brachypodium distachyon TaxID=15368 RepID=A0A0Q3JTT1_BRADI|nr:hypothetical protein BRADI_1g23095v3 [Brachypodium distachyon]